MAIMTTVLDPSRPFSAELHIIRRLNSSLLGAGATRAGFNSRPQGAGLAPSRDDVPLLDPCCSLLSAGAEAALGLEGRAKFIDFHHVASDLRVPPGFRERPQTVSNLYSLCVDTRRDKAWNSRKIPDAVLRARLSGKISEHHVYICLIYNTMILLCTHRL